MKNKIIVFMLSAMILLASLAIGVYADEVKSEVFTLTTSIDKLTFELTTTKENSTFAVEKYNLLDDSKTYIDTMFDKTFYDAEVYGAYTVSPTDSADLSVTFTIKLNDILYDTEVFVFAIDKNSGKATPVLKSERDGANLIIKGEDFAPVSDDIIVVMTSNQSLMTGPEYTYIPAAVCAGVAVIAITVSVLVVKKKSSKETITG